jgi:NADPH:quinone reductase-like Zn-dependent oxidoreductase
MSRTGRAIVIRSNGGPEVLENVTDYSFPGAADDEVLIQTVSSSVNPVDIYIRKGLFGPLADSPTVQFIPFPVPKTLHGSVVVAAVAIQSNCDFYF